MKTFASLALAGALGLAAVVPTAATASADGYYWHGPHYRHHHDRWNDGDFAAGAILGLTFGALSAPRYAPYDYGYYDDYPPPPPRYTAGDAHIRWCSAHYASYSPEDNTWLDYYGRVHQCVGPY
jgi:hypothetical protein